jgi:hypothetical protein
MPYRLEISPDRTHIILTIQGDITRERAMKFNIEAHVLGRKHGINRYLVDATESRNTDSPVGNYAFAYEDMATVPDIDRTAQVAILVSPGDHSHDFVETVSRNSGLNVTIFTDRRLAEESLKGA